MTKEQRWRELLAEQASSPLSVRAFCRERQLGEAAFYSWRKTIRTRDGLIAPANQEPAFVPVMLTAEAPAADFVLELTSGRRLRIPNAISSARLADLLLALEARGAS